MTKITGIKEAIGDAKRCFYYRIMLNPQTGRVWADTFGTNNNYVLYSNKNIINVVNGRGEFGDFGFDGLTMKQLKALCEEELMYWELGRGK